MDYKKIQAKAKGWLEEIKKRYNYQQIEPCDFFINELTVLDLIMIADDVEMLSEMIIVHKKEKIIPCICETLKYIPVLEKNECYKTLRAGDVVDMKRCVEENKVNMATMMSNIIPQDKEK